ncbi:MAG: SDR family NAD(P)-dependent oxidoreductase [Alphaproteobacteria bacterium]|nr:SDR family NAD(P)-dependent oxidoreductase [Alphaproteobacteria bacterium]
MDISPDQKPIGSGYKAKSSPDEIMAGIDLSGRNAIVTGGYSGIGLETTRAMAKAGAKVVVPARRPDAAKTALADVEGDIAVAAMDLADIGSVRAFAADFAAAHDRLHLLINNAGIMACPEETVGPGWERQFGVNHLGHAALFAGLEPAIRKAGADGGARVVALSSTGHKRSPVRFDDPFFKQEPYHKWTAYGQAKTANSLFAVGVDMRLKNDGVRAFAVHPGGIMTPLQRHLTEEEMVELGWKDPSGGLSEVARSLFKTPPQGATTTLFAATSPKLGGVGGVYCEDCDVAPVAGPDSVYYMHVAPHAVDREQAARLWDMTERLLAGA